MFFLKKEKTAKYTNCRQLEKLTFRYWSVDTCLSFDIIIKEDSVLMKINTTFANSKSQKLLDFALIVIC